VKNSASTHRRVNLILMYFLFFFNFYKKIHKVFSSGFDELLIRYLDFKNKELHCVTLFRLSWVLSSKIPEGLWVISLCFYPLIILTFHEPFTLSRRGAHWCIIVTVRAPRPDEVDGKVHETSQIFWSFWITPRIYLYMHAHAHF